MKRYWYNCSYTGDISGHGTFTSIKAKLTGVDLQIILDQLKERHGVKEITITHYARV